MVTLVYSLQVSVLIPFWKYVTTLADSKNSGDVSRRTNELNHDSVEHLGPSFDGYDIGV